MTRAEELAEKVEAAEAEMERWKHAAMTQNELLRAAVADAEALAEALERIKRLPERDYALAAVRIADAVLARYRGEK